MSSCTLRVIFGRGFEGYPEYTVIVDEACAPADLEAYLCKAGILPEPFEGVQEGELPVVYSLHFKSRILEYNQSLVGQGVSEDADVVFTGEYLRGEEEIVKWGNRTVGAAGHVLSCLEISEITPDVANEQLRRLLDP